MTRSLESNQVATTVQSLGEQAVLPLTFVQIEGYTTFRAEFAVTEGDLVFHFFMTPEIEALPEKERKHYWAERFAEVLEPVAKEHFLADAPRIKAQHVCDMGIDSWWFRAKGFGHLLDPHRFAYQFLDKLDQALDDQISK